MRETVHSRRASDASFDDAELASWLAATQHAAARHHRLADLSNRAGAGRFLAIAIRLRDKVREVGFTRTVALAWSILRSRLRSAG